MGDVDYTVTRLVLKKISERAAIDRLTATRLRGTPELAVYAQLFDNATRFWQKLARVIGDGTPPTAEQAFVMRYLRTPIERRVLAAVEPGTVVA